MLQSFLTYINDRSLFEPHQKIILAVSGGRDSMLMLDLFYRSGFNFVVAHCNFRLRGEASEGDEAFVREYCVTRSIPFFNKDFDTKKEAKKRGVSTQMVARELRYEWFEELRLSLSSDYIAVAHHVNDAVETLFLNMAKGTGPRGLRSIPVKAGRIIRPMMFTGSDEITAYMTEHKLGWRDDVSNDSVDYQRNKIRHMVVPILKEINPSLEETVKRNIARFEELGAIFNDKLENFQHMLVKNAGHSFEINMEELRRWTGYKLLLEEFLKPYGFNFSQVSDMILTTTPGKIFQSPGFILETGRAVWFLRPVQDHASEEIIIHREDYEVSFSLGKLIFSETEKQPGKEDLKFKDRAWLDLEKLEFPLILRLWKNGDTFRPFGMKGNKKVSDYLIDHKVDVFNKNKQYVLCDQSGIVWLVGHRIDDRCRISETTPSVLKIELH